jgi:hypothetical protein
MAIATNQRLSMRHLKNAILRFTATNRRADHCNEWWSYVGSFGDDFFGDDFSDELVSISNE